MTTFGDQVYQYGGAPVGGLFTPAGDEVYFVKPNSGNNQNQGKKPTDALATLQQAHTNINADKNGVVYLVSEDNSASGTTNRIAGATFTWSKDGTNIVGVASGGMIGSRARISNTADTTDVSPLMEWSASNGSMRNVHIFYGEADAGDLGAFLVSGERNYFKNCHFAGIGNATQDAAGAYSLSVSGDENLFEDCVIGIDTIGRGSAANSELLFPASGQATRNIFRRCIFLTFADAATHQFITTGASGLDRWALFQECLFINPVDSTATAMTEAFDLSATQGGSIILQDCGLYGATEWDAGDTGNILIVGASGTAATSGIAIEPAV
jgi:hypothetical protein